MKMRMHILVYVCIYILIRKLFWDSHNCQFSRLKLRYWRYTRTYVFDNLIVYTIKFWLYQMFFKIYCDNDLSGKIVWVLDSCIHFIPKKSHKIWINVRKPIQARHLLPILTIPYNISANEKKSLENIEVFIQIVFRLSRFYIHWSTNIIRYKPSSIYIKIVINGFRCDKPIIF